ncbi:alpha/beta hydrolase [Leifsonia sp. NPDC058230]|uniref:alpha/beta hydrolase n=1 Tax=Leifsonia sp. NPDC058230 TaxID=3346391 RepID=UPI0036DA2D76
MDTRDPGAGEPAAIRGLAAVRSTKAESLRAVHSDVTASVNAVSESEWRGKSRVAFISAVESVSPELLVLANGLDAQAQALGSYAAQVQQIKDRQAALELQRSRALSALETFQRSLDASHHRDDRALLEEAVGRRDDRTTAILRQRTQLTESLGAEQSRLKMIDAQWEELISWRRQADRVCADALSGKAALGATWQFNDRTIRTTAPADLAGMLVGLSANDLRLLVAVYPALGEKVAQLDPGVAAAWWNGMNDALEGAPSAAQAALIAGIPGVIGNLDGVAYWARDRANNVFLERALADELVHPTENVERIRALDAVKAALGKGVLESPPRQLVSLSFEPDPKAAISVGDLDKAANATYLVPGMGTNVAGNVGSYVDAAFALRRYQKGFLSSDASAYAVVAWLDYSPPGPRDSLGVAQDYLAEAGARRLAGTLSGLNAVHSATGSTIDVSVVGHSYGTAVAALALTQANADHLVMLGSAGIPNTIPNAEALNVPSGEVFASQGHHDGWAVTGQASSKRQDPTGPSFGAHAFTSEESLDDQGRPLNKITQHGPFAPRGEEGKYSYLDRNTSAMYNTAKATIGQGRDLPVGGTPTDRLALQLKDRAIDMMTKGTVWVPQG